LQKEFPLLFILFGNELHPILNIQFPVKSISIKEGNEGFKSSNQPLAVDNSVMLFGNSRLYNIEPEGSRKLGDHESVEGSKTSSSASIKATEFCNFIKK